MRVKTGGGVEERKGRRERKEREGEMQRGDQKSCEGKRGMIDRCDAEIGVGVWLDRNNWNEDRHKERARKGGESERNG